jgi:LytS/YehU family sensor histidine kinase
VLTGINPYKSAWLAYINEVTGKLAIRSNVIPEVSAKSCGESIGMRIVGELYEGTVVFKVIDDGIGIHPETIRQIFDPVDSINVGLGIRNVDQRIRLYYGKDYGVSIYSSFQKILPSSK